jgi:osmoprotectant transport system permease protein
MFDQLPDLLENLPRYLGGHMLLSATALAVGLTVSVPLGILASRRPRLTEMTLGAAGVIQTVPSLALLALMVIVLRGLIGFWPAFIALTLYSVLPILANTVLGLKGVDATLIEAGRGLGMSERQLLFRVQLPLALPVLIGGIRTATVLVVGTATLAMPVGGVSLGNYIFSGLESMNPTSTVFGCLVAALLAVVMDQLVRLLEVAARRRSRALAWAGGLGLLFVLGAGLASPVAGLFEQRRPAVVASGPFTEQHVLNELIAQRLRRAGFRPDQRPSMSEGIQVEALRHNQIDCMVNYSGNIWTLVMKMTDVPDDPRTVSDEVARYLQRECGIECLGSLGFEDAYAFAMTRSGARHLPSSDYSLEALADYARDRAAQGKRLRLGADSQFFTRPEWRWVKRAYRLGEADVERVEMDPALMYGAVRDGQLDAIVAYTSDGRIPAYDLELLSDPRRALPPYDALLLLSPEAARRPGFREALQPLRNAVSLDAMRRANLHVDGEDGWSPRRAAAELDGALGRAERRTEKVGGPRGSPG